MSRSTTDLAIVFADISGSTRLYETLGDAVARELVSQCLDLMREQITKFDGTVIKTIGDEIMCTFPTAERATESSMGMQEAITEDLPDMNPNMPSTMTIRIGLHFGSAILEGGDVFGDAVNVAARMAGLAKGGQIITTQQTAEELPPILRSSTRHLDRIPVKGKADLIDIFEVIWQPEDVTRIATNVLKKQTRSVSLKLVYHDKVMRLNETSGTVILGRVEKSGYGGERHHGLARACPYRVSPRQVCAYRPEHQWHVRCHRGWTRLSAPRRDNVDRGRQDQLWA